MTGRQAGSPSTHQALSPTATALMQVTTQRIRSLLQRSASDIVSIGNELARVKAVLPHGRFGVWCEQDLGLSLRTAERFMQVSARLGNNVDRLPMLGTDALYALAAPSTPDHIVNDVIAGRIEPSPKAIRDAIRQQSGSVDTGRQPIAPWQAVGNLIDRYPEMNHGTLAAEILVYLAYSCEVPDRNRIEREVRSYPAESQEDVRDAVSELALVLSKWADAHG